MKNIFCNLQSVHSKHLINIRRISVSSTSIKCFSNYLLTCQSTNEQDSVRRRGVFLSKEHIRSFNTSVQKLEKLADKKENLNIIYSGPLTHRIKGVKVFTIMTSIGGIAMQPWMVQNILSQSDMPLGVALLSCVGFFTFVTPFLCHLITKKYVTEIWYNPATDTYTATVLSFFLRKININFKIEDIRVPTIPPMFSTMYIKGRPLFIIVDSFLEVEHYIKMMGYDKPLDFKLQPESNSSENSEKEEKSKLM